MVMQRGNFTIETCVRFQCLIIKSRTIGVRIFGLIMNKILHKELGTLGLQGPGPRNGAGGAPWGTSEAPAPTPNFF